MSKFVLIGRGSSKCNFVWLARKEGERFLIFGQGETSNSRPGGSFTLPLHCLCREGNIWAIMFRQWAVFYSRCPKQPSSSRAITTNVPTMVIINQNPRRKARFKRADLTCSPVIDTGQTIQESTTRKKTRPGLQWRIVPQLENCSENQKSGRQAPYSDESRCPCTTPSDVVFALPFSMCFFWYDLTSTSLLPNGARLEHLYLRSFLL